MDILAGVTARLDVTIQNLGYKARIETREFDPNWVALYDPGNPATCNPNGMVVGEGSQRAVIWFKLE